MVGVEATEVVVVAVEEILIIITNTIARMKAREVDTKDGEVMALQESTILGTMATGARTMKHLDILMVTRANLKTTKEVVVDLEAKDVAAVVSGTITMMGIKVEVITKEMEVIGKIPINKTVIASLTIKTIMVLSSRSLTLKMKEMARCKRTLASKVSTNLIRTSSINQILIVTEVAISSKTTTVVAIEVATATTISNATPEVDKATPTVVASQIGNSRLKATGLSSLLGSIQAKVISKLDLLRKRLIQI